MWVCCIWLLVADWLFVVFNSGGAGCAAFVIVVFALCVWFVLVVLWCVVWIWFELVLVVLLVVSVLLLVSVCFGLVCV